MLGSKRSGFTLVELIVVTPFIILLIGAFIAVAVNLTGEAIASRAQSSLIHSIDDALDRIRSDVRMSKEFLATNSVTIVSPQGSDEASAPFKNATTEGAALIMRTLALTERPDNSNTQPINLKGAPLASCSHPFIATNQRMSVNVVYFVRDNSLWRRVLMPANYDSIGCDTPWRLPTCKPGYSAAQTHCKTNDEQLIDGVGSENFTVEYFTSSSTQSPLLIASDSSATDSARASILQTSMSVRVTITAEQAHAGRDIQESLSMRTTRSVGRQS